MTLNEFVDSVKLNLAVFRWYNGGGKWVATIYLTDLVKDDDLVKAEGIGKTPDAAMIDLAAKISNQTIKFGPNYIKVPNLLDN